MYHSALVPLSPMSASNDNSSQDELQLSEQTFLSHLQTTGTKSLILSPFTLAFSPTTLLQMGGADGTVSPLHHSTQSLGSNHPDFTGLLPAEIVVNILLRLDPQDLCSASAVCCRWYQLAQYSVLDRRKKVYIEHKRREYLSSKENYTPGASRTRAPMTKAPSPLGSIQPLPLSPSFTSQHHSQPTSPSVWDSPRSPAASPILMTPPMSLMYTPPYQPRSPSWNHTSSPTLLLDDVKFLSLDDKDIMLYRPLSPELRWVESTLYSLRQVAGRKNKNRLRRL